MSSFKVPIVEAVLVELDLQRLVRDEDEVGNFDPKKSQVWSCTPILGTFPWTILDRFSENFQTASDHPTIPPALVSENNVAL